MRELLNRQLLEVAAAKVVPALAGVGFITIAAKLCAPADYGIFALAFATANLCSVLAVVWLSQSVLRFAGGSLGVQPLRAITVIALACTALSCLGHWLLVTSGVVALARTTQAIWWAVPLLATALSLNVLAGAFATATQRFRDYRTAEVARGALLLGLVAVAGGTGAGAAGLVMAYGVGTAVPSVLLLARLRPAAAPEHMVSISPLLRQFMRYGWPMTLWAGLQASQALIERSVLGGHLNSELFGRFIAASDMITRGVGLALMPVVTYAHAQLMATTGRGTRLDAGGRRLLRHGAALIAGGGLVLTLAVLAAQPLLGRLLPGLAELDRLTLGLLCLGALAWTLALIAHKPLELANQTLRMSALLAAVVGLQWWLLQTWIDALQVRAMPLASLVAASVYLLGCAVLGKRGIVV